MLRVDVFPLVLNKIIRLPKKHWVKDMEIIEIELPVCSISNSIVRTAVTMLACVAGWRYSSRAIAHFWWRSRH